MKVLKILFAAGLLFAAGVAVAGKGGPIASGIWSGDGHAIYPDGTIVEITEVYADLTQVGHFIYGLASFEVEGLGTQEGQMSARIRGNAISGVLGGCFGAAPDCVGVGVFDGKLRGNRLTGTVRDLSDGSTSVITLYRVPD